MAPTPCTREDHNRIRRDRAALLRDTMPGGDHIEGTRVVFSLRHCIKCHSTIAISPRMAQALIGPSKPLAKKVVAL